MYKLNEVTIKISMTFWVNEVSHWARELVCKPGPSDLTKPMEILKGKRREVTLQSHTYVSTCACTHTHITNKNVFNSNDIFGY